MGRRDSSALGDLIDVTAMLPWWAGFSLAVLSYIALHTVAAIHPDKPVELHDMGAFTVKQLGITFALFGQYVLPAAFAGGAGLSALGRLRRTRLLGSAAQEGAARLASMGWQEFERLVAEAFRRRGFAVRETGGGGADGGVDLILAKDGETRLVQCKHWRTRRVGVKPVRELAGVMGAAGAVGAVVVTSGTYTAAARGFAADAAVELIDGPGLLDLVRGIEPQPGAVRAADAEDTGPSVPPRPASPSRPFGRGRPV